LVIAAAVNDDMGSLYLFDRNGTLRGKCPAGENITDYGYLQDSRTVVVYSGMNRSWYDYSCNKVLFEKDPAPERCGSPGSDDLIRLEKLNGLWTYKLLTPVHRIAYAPGCGYRAESSMVNQSAFFRLYSSNKLLWTNKTEGRISAVGVSPEGMYAAASSENSTYGNRVVRLFDALGVLQWTRETENRVYALSLSRNAEYILAGSVYRIILYDRKGNIVWSQETDGTVLDAKISPDGRHIAYSTGEGWIYYAVNYLPSCSDGIRNQKESDIDCSGPCQKCRENALCMSGTDCDTGWCNNGVCAKPACDDGVKNQGETDIDCGGSCSPCADGMYCIKDADCLTGWCGNKNCTIPTCSDGVKNQNESKIDCGGPCKPCPAECRIDSDCGGFSIGAPYCMNNAVYKDYITPECVNNTCVKTAEERIFERCMDSMCEKGSCILREE
jgi:dipeptidyl aminopeptidase/acylaminoacyl peptidase